MNYKEKFNNQIELTIEYLSNSGGLEPLLHEHYKGFYLKKFMNKLRTIYNKGKKLTNGDIKNGSDILTLDQIEKLNNVNFNWIRETNEVRFEKNFNLLIDFLNEFNRYPYALEMYKNINIGTWVCTLRKIYKNGVKNEDESISYYYSLGENKRYVLTKKQIDMLNSINFDWYNKSIYKNVKEDSWNTHFESLKKYLKENNKYPTMHEIYENFNLGLWVNRQRCILTKGTLLKDESIKYGQTYLSKDKIQKLMSIDFEPIGDKKKVFKKEFTNKKEQLLKERYLLYKLEIIMKNKDIIKLKEDIDNINKELIKKL